jgi:hypothetical protein
MHKMLCAMVFQPYRRQSTMGKYTSKCDIPSTRYAKKRLSDTPQYDCLARQSLMVRCNLHYDGDIRISFKNSIEKMEA